MSLRPRENGPAKHTERRSTVDGRHNETGWGRDGATERLILQRQNADPPPVSSPGHRRSELAWTAVPTLTLPADEGPVDGVR